MLALLPVRAFALNSRESNPSIIDIPDARIKVHDESNIRFTISNFAHFGNSGDMDDPDGGGVAPCGEYPAYSGKEYFFAGALWIGAEIDTVDQNGDPMLDTLVSIGLDGWIGISSEMYPSPGDDQSLWEERNIGDQEYAAVYVDTLTDPAYIPEDYYDQRLHIPLGVKITQHSMCWSSPGYDETFVIDFILENVWGRDLSNVWLGFYNDADIWHNSESPYGPEQGQRTIFAVL